MNIAERKREIRKWMAERRRRFTEEERREAGIRLRDNLIDFPLWATARTLAAFWPLGKEPDVAPLLRRWAAEGRTLALPRVEGTRPEDIQLYRVAEPDSDLAPGTLGILEPDPNRCAILPPDAVDWIWVPGVAFDSACGRLGRGKAYYDSLLSRIPRGQTHRTGIAYDWQIVEEELPRDSWDEPLDSVVTDHRAILASGPTF